MRPHPRFANRMREIAFQQRDRDLHCLPGVNGGSMGVNGGSMGLNGDPGLWAAAMESIGESVVITDLEGRICFVNRAFTEMTGYSAEEALRGSPSMLKSGLTSAATYKDLWATVLEGSTWRGELVNRRKDGTLYRASLSVAPVGTGEQRYLVASHRDVTKRRRMEAAVRRLAAVGRTGQDFFAELVTNLAEALGARLVGVADRVGDRLETRAVCEHGVLVANHSLALAGTPWQQAIDQGLYLERSGLRTRFPEVERVQRLALDSFLGSALRDDQGEVAGVLWVADVAPLSDLDFVLPTFAVFNASAAGELADLRERKRLNAQMMHMDRVIGLGSLATGITHDINNPLSCVLSNLEIALEDLPGLEALIGGDPPRGAIRHPALERLAGIKEALQDAQLGAHRVRDSIRSLKVFSRMGDEAATPLPLAKIVESALLMASHEIRDRARVVMEIPPALKVFASESRLGQVFLDLLVNAAHAIAPGDRDANTIRLAAQQQGDRVVIEVADSGTGIRPEHLARIFEPFFTTKPVGQGTGMGLAISRGVVESLGGTLTLQSELGRGTVFRLELRSAGSEPVAPEALHSVPCTGHQILVVDDEASIGNVFRRALGRGNAVATALSGREALAMIEAGQRFDVIVCDMMMPEMTGMLLQQRVRAQAPALAERFIFMTGCALNPLVRTFLDGTTSPWIEKPITLPQLTREIEKLGPAPHDSA